MNGLKFTEEVASQLERNYLTKDVVAQRSETIKQLALSEGERVLDIGSGPGSSFAEPPFFSVSAAHAAPISTLLPGQDGWAFRSIYARRVAFYHSGRCETVMNEFF